MKGNGEVNQTNANNQKLPPGVVPTIEELAVALGVHRRSIQSWRHKPDYPHRPDGNHHIVEVENWRRGVLWKSVDQDREGCWAADFENRAAALIDSLKAMQTEAVKRLPEGQRAEFASWLEKTIGDAILDAFGGKYDFLYFQDYKGESDEQYDERNV